jgi:regulator of protease activity HflC (stomatin/prohibitin superfamily)
MISNFLIAGVVTFFAMFIVAPMFLGLLRGLGLYAIVEERQCKVYVLFGQVVGILQEPGLKWLFVELGWKAPLVNWMGKCYTIDLRLDQSYLRSQPVNSEEGAPMGIGIWYEMYISDPTSYLFKNADPRGSLGANVSNASVRCLSNMKLADMLENRHKMSQVVRTEVCEKSQEWGYKLGSVYIRKVHFRDEGMIRQIEFKVVNRLRQVTSAIKQDGANQVSIITSTADRQAAIEFAKAAAMRPQIVGRALQEIGRDPAILKSVFDTLEIERLVAGQAEIILVPEGSDMLKQMLAAERSSTRVASAVPAGATAAKPPPAPKG